MSFLGTYCRLVNQLDCKPCCWQQIQPFHRQSDAKQQYCVANIGLFERKCEHATQQQILHAAERQHMVRVGRVVRSAARSKPRPSKRFDYAAKLITSTMLL